MGVTEVWAIHMREPVSDNWVDSEEPFSVEQDGSRFRKATWMREARGTGGLDQHYVDEACRGRMRSGRMTKKTP